MNPTVFDVLGVVPADLSHPGLAVAVSRAGGIGILDLQFAGDETLAAANFERLLATTESRVGLRFTAGSLPLARRLLASAGNRHLTLVLAGPAESYAELRAQVASAVPHDVLGEILRADDAAIAESACDGLIARGNEAGGWVGDDSSFILLQKLRGKLRKRLFAQGGIGVRSAAACRAAGAAGVVVDDALMLLSESPLPLALRNELARLNGTECRVFGESLGHPLRAYARPGSAPLKAVEDLAREAESGAIDGDAWVHGIAANCGWSADKALPLGQAIGLAVGARDAHGSVVRFVQTLRRQSLRQIDRAAELAFLDEGGPLAASHRTRFPVAQGPMTRVSDNAAFAGEVARGGALPFLALALMRGPEVAQLLAQTREQVGDAPWGVGLLGFVPQALRDEQCAEVWKCKPPFALIAGGRPDQAEEFEKRGIATYLHAPAPALLKMYLEQGARRFVFEGRECGGHVGPLASFPLWEQMIEVLLAHVPAGEEKKIHVLFAGGLHDGLSGAMVASLAAPLADRGMRVGVLMGTAYLFTREIVASGAVVEGFQQAALQCARTVNLESGPGHATRCVDTAFARDFHETRRRLMREGRSVEEIRDELEDLNLGRLRVASKGRGRDHDGKLVDISAERQQRDGMFMIGQVATLRDSVLSIEELHGAVCNGGQQLLEQSREDRAQRVEAAKPSDIAIVGIGVTLPKADSADDYWQIILDRISVIREAPKDRWDWEQFYDADQKAPDKVYSKWGGFLDEVPIDPMRFGIPPKSMKSIDPFQLLALETASRTLADAGYSDGQFDRENTSVILGAGGGAGDLGAQYALRAELPRFVENPSPEVWDRLPEWTEESFAGTLLNVAAGRIANRLDFGGLNFTIDAACGSSLAAIGMAVNELESGRSSLVLAGGFDTTQSAYAFTAFAKTQALSPTGKPRTFDQSADGIAISEGVAMIALKRLADAERDGDRIYAVIKATAGSSDGRALGLTAPRTEGQIRALKRAYRKAGFSPSTLGLVEAHGTGTPVGDRTEAQTIAQTLLDDGAAPRTVALGSVKTLLGHTKAAAGVSGLIKVALALHHRVLPAHYGVERPIDTLSDARSPVYLLKEARPWLSTPDHPRRGAASAFGFGGTNFHAVLEEYQGTAASAGSNRWPAELFLFRAPDVASLQAQLERLVPQVQPGSRIRPGELAAALARQAESNLGQALALAIVATDLKSLAADLAAAIAHLQGGTRPLPGNVRLSRNVPAASPVVAFLFPGQGAQYLNMGREAALFFPEVREAFELADRCLRTAIPEGLSRYVFPPSPFDAQTETAQLAALTDTRVAQPAIGSAALGYLKLARRLGLQASACAGHSYGEYAALMAAGVLSTEDFLRLSAVRGAAMAAASESSVPGGMAAVQGSRERVQALIGGFDGVRVANHNTPDQSVISGPRETLNRAVQKLEAAGLRATLLPVSGAFHTELVAPARGPLTEAIHATRFNEARIDVYSNSSGAPYPRQPEAMQRLLDGHLLSSVEFVTEIEAMYAAGCRVFVELGPKGICSNMARQTLAGRDAVATSLDASGGGLRGLLLGLADLFIAGVHFEVQSLFSGRELERLELSRLADFARPRALPRHTWMVSGGCARAIDDPVHRTGKKPALTRADAETARAAIDAAVEARVRASLPATGVGATPSSQPVAPSASLTSEALIAYQQTMRQFLQLQERVVSQYLNGATPSVPVAGMMDAMSMPAMPAPAPAPVVARVAAPVVVATSIAVPVVQPAPIAVVAAQLDVSALLLGIVSERTGYPADMLGMDADLEADLGIDSIKRVEIIGALRKALGAEAAGTVQSRMERLTKARSLQAILNELGPVASAAPAVAAPAVVVVAQPAVALDFSALLLGIVAERTGYPQDMLGLDADLEADLGIDSIKRVEIIGALRKSLPAGVSEVLQSRMEALTKARSLSSILALLPSSSAPIAATVVVDAVPAAVVVVDAPALIDLNSLLVGIVAERTGYPADMLGMDADLEADLGIDSIKRVEILGALKKSLPGAQGAALQSRMEVLTKARTLNQLLSELRHSEAAVPAASASSSNTLATSAVQESVAAQADATAAPLPRFVVKARSAPRLHGEERPDGLVLLLGPKGTISRRVLEDLTARKLIAVHLDTTDAQALRAAIESAQQQHGPARGLLHLHGLEVGDAADLAAWQSMYHRDLLSLFHALQCIAELPKLRLIAASRLGGTFGRDAVGQGGAIAGGVNGMLNCVRSEFPGCHARAVDFDGQTDEEIASLLVAELLTQSAEPEAGYIGTERFGSVTVEEALTPNPFPQPVTPQSGWVMLATGGARGITAEILEELACPGMRLVLVGRTPEPGAEDVGLAAQVSEADVRRHLLAAARHRGEKPRPVEIDRALGRVLTDREIRANLKRLRATGAEVDYVSCDVRDERSFGGLIEGLYDRYKRIDAVIHGAGVIEDRRLADKTAESFERVIGTKLDPAHILAKRLRPASLKLMAFFTSVAGRYGNQGQTDYAAANEALNRLAWQLHREWTHTRVISVNWGPWDAGMASEGVKRALRERGMEPIPVAAGRRLFRDELEHGPRHEVELVAGRGPWGEAAAEDRRRGWSLDALQVVAGGAVTAELRLDDAASETDGAALKDAMSQFVAQAWTGWNVAELRDVRLPAQPTMRGKLRARAATHSEPDVQAVTVELVQSGSRKVLSRATVILRPQSTSTTRIAPAGP
ncbi:type I polyketide synthase [Panacagrimonas perspica]|uniref:type I polyketide synthase n=1 Tax=Panacagrimonas perspica TaxID=381431 RepID=UPI001FEC4A6E|nr:type I polyketide synthase [Panacagrimonas perspica]